MRGSRSRIPPTGREDRDRKGNWAVGEREWKTEERKSIDKSPVFKIPVRLGETFALSSSRDGRYRRPTLGNAERGQIGVVGADRKGVVVVVVVAVAVVWRKLGEGLQSRTDCRGDK